MPVMSEKCPIPFPLLASVATGIAIILLGSGFAAAPGDILFQREGADAQNSSYPPATFPHWVHRIRYRCDTCHPRIFNMQAGSTTITMDLIGQEMVCGECHNGTVAFDVDFQSCSRCHQPNDE